MQTSCIILAAGFSKRMGQPKAFLSFNNEKCFLQKLIDTFSLKCSEIIVVINQKVYSENFNQITSLEGNFRVALNNNPEYERFFSVKLGVQSLENKHECFIHNVDNPFIDENVLESLTAKKTDSGYVVPVFEKKGGHPILLKKDVIYYICNSAKNNDNLRSVLKKFTRHDIECHNDNILFNINTFEQLAIIKERLKF